MNLLNYSSRNWLLLMLGGLALVLAGVSCLTSGQNLDTQPPDENRFTTTILNEAGSLDEPMAFTFLTEKEMLIVERKGGVKAFNVAYKDLRQVGFVPVNTKYVNQEGQSREAEEGLMGVIAHPDYASNHWVFMLYADPDEPKHVLARWVFKDDSLHEASKVVVLEYPVQRQECCHTGGGMAFDKDGNLFLTTGNNTVNPPRGTSNLDERPGMENSDDQRTAGNTNDLRGKILRIHPEDDGSYTIPEGNLFVEESDLTRPEIYTMGHRNPWRVSVDSETGYIYWGEVGPDASEDTEYGPMGYDEFNQAKGPGFFGWPYFIADNQPYADVDFEKDSLGELFDPNHVLNHSPNNTGLTELPAPQKAFLWYPYSFSEEFPLLGSAGRSATGGPVFRAADFPKSDKRFPAYYEGKWLLVDFMRGWIMSVSMDEKGDFLEMERFLPEENFSSAIDMQFSPDGDLYVLEYGSAWFRGNPNSYVKRIQYNGGNRPPIVQAGAEQMAGALPFTVQLSSEGTRDDDQDKLSYQWSITSENGFSKAFQEANPDLTLEKAGIYRVSLTVEDGKGNSNEQSFELVAGNAPPEVQLDLLSGNQTFYFPDQELAYAISVSDQEDGSTQAGTISREAIAVNFDYAPEGFDPIEIAQNHRSTDDWVSFSRGRKLIDESDCLSCHRVEVKSIGPSYQAVSEKYQHDPREQAQLAERIIKGSVGRWGEHGMSAHPDLSQEDAQSMVDYIMSLADPQSAPAPIPLAGSFATAAPEGTNGKGSYLLRVAYTDQGAEGLKPLTSETIIALRNPTILAEKYDEESGTQLLTTPRRVFNIVAHDAFLRYADLDLTGIGEIEIGAEASGRSGALGAIIELRLDAVDGTLVGTTEKVEPMDIDYRAELQKLVAAWEKGGKKGPRPTFGTVMNLFRPKFSVPVSGISGTHDLFLVFKNPEAKPGQNLVQMRTLTFHAGDAPTP